MPWLALWFLAMSWPLALPTYEAPGAGGAKAVGLALAMLAFARGPGPFASLPGRHLVLLAAGGAAAASVIPTPWRVFPMLLVVAAVLEPGRRRLPALAFATRAAGLGGLVGAGQAALVPFLQLFLANHHRVSIGDGLLGLVRPLWPGAAATGGTLYLPAAERLYALTPTWESLGLFPGALFVAGGLAWLLARRVGGPKVISFALLVIAYFGWRWVALGFLVTRVNSDHLFWHGPHLALSFLPLAGLCALFFPLADGHAHPSPAAPSRSRLAAPAGFLAAFGLAGALAFHDPGTPKAGRLLVDERHSDWEWTTEELDTEWYGRKSGYNYWSLVEWLRCHFEVDVRDEELTPQLLAGYDILFIKTPTTPFSPAEIEAVRRFVAGGGGLFLDGDHTNVFGTSTYLNELAAPYGLRFRYDSTYDLVTGDLSLWKPPRVAPHPVVRHLPPYLFATSCTLEAPWPHEPVIVGYGLRTMYLDYSRTSFFPEREGVTDDLFGLFLQAAGVTYGRGRVLGYTDSTCFSNFFVFIPGKPELALGCFDWLNRRNRWHRVNGLLLLAGLLALGVAAVSGRGAGAAWLAGLCGGGGVGIAAALALAEAVDRRAYPPLEPRRPPVTIAFEREHSRYTLPDLRLTRSPDASFHTFFVWVQRLGFVPRAYDTFEEALEKGDVVVVINPAVEFAVAEADSLYAFLRRGGKALVMSDPRDSQHAANQLLGGVGMAFEGAGVDSTGLWARDGTEIGSGRQVGTVTGGESIVIRDDGRVVLAATDRGRGRLAAMAASNVFTDRTLGATGVVPSPEQRRLYDLEFRLLRDLLVGMGPLPPAEPPDRIGSR